MITFLLARKVTPNQTVIRLHFIVHQTRQHGVMIKDVRYWNVSHADNGTQARQEYFTTQAALCRVAYWGVVSSDTPDIYVWLYYRYRITGIPDSWRTLYHGRTSLCLCCVHNRWRSNTAFVSASVSSTPDGHNPYNKVQLYRNALHSVVLNAQIVLHTSDINCGRRTRQLFSGNCVYRPTIPDSIMFPQ